MIMYHPPHNSMLNTKTKSSSPRIEFYKFGVYNEFIAQCAAYILPFPFLTFDVLLQLTGPLMNNLWPFVTE